MHYQVRREGRNSCFFNRLIRASPCSLHLPTRLQHRLLCCIFFAVGTSLLRNKWTGLTIKCQSNWWGGGGWWWNNFLNVISFHPVVVLCICKVQIALFKSMQFWWEAEMYFSTSAPYLYIVGALKTISAFAWRLTYISPIQKVITVIICCAISISTDLHQTTRLESGWNKIILFSFQ